MGISKLADLIRSEAAGAVSYKETSDYTGKVIALDASIVLNQFRTAGPQLYNSNRVNLNLLTGLFFRTLHFLEHEIKPVFVFDGLPPEQKRGELEKRAKATGRCISYSSGTDSPQIRDCQRILQLLGVPYIQAPGDGEALCARLAKGGKVDAVASEDMDTLPFGGGLLLRQLTAKKSSEVREYSLSKLLDALQLTHKQFVDLCILLGCDYCEKIQGLGPKRALKLIQQHKTIEEVVLHINRETHPVPLCWKYQEARRLFLEAPEGDLPELTWGEPNEEGLVHFLCHKKHVTESRVRGRMAKFRLTLQERMREREEENKAGTNRQMRMEEFFRVTRKRQATQLTREVQHQLEERHIPLGGSASPQESRTPISKALGPSSRKRAKPQ